MLRVPEREVGRLTSLERRHELARKLALGREVEEENRKRRAAVARPGMRRRAPAPPAVVLAAALILAPLGVRAADLGVWWSGGYPILTSFRTP